MSGTPKPSIENAALGMVQQSLSLLFPGHKMNAKVGDTWSDTTKNDATTEAGSQTGTTVTEWKVLSMTDDGYVMEGASKGTMTATQGGGELNIATKMTGTQKVTTSAMGPSRTGENTMQDRRHRDHQPGPGPDPGERQHDGDGHRASVTDSTPDAPSAATLRGGRRAFWGWRGVALRDHLPHMLVSGVPMRITNLALAGAVAVAACAPSASAPRPNPSAAAARARAG